MEFGKKKTQGDGCTSCGVGSRGQIDPKAFQKQLKEAMKNKAKPIPCPYLEECDFKMIPQIGEMLCLDEEVGGQRGQGFMVHLQGRHMWESCRKFAEIKREKEGVLPKDLQKILKAKKK